MITNANVSKPGLFIALEGADGSGKTTMLQYITARFERYGESVVKTREIGGSPVAEKLRALITGSDKSVAHEPVDKHAQLLMVLASRIQHQKTTIFPAVRDGKLVLSDRCFDSTYVYQGRKNDLLPMLSVLENLEEIRHLSFRPDYTIFFDVSPEVSMQRTEAERAFVDNQMNEGGGLEERTQDILSYRTRMAQAQTQKPGSIIHIDADQSMDKVERMLDVFVDGLVSMRHLAAEQKAAEDAKTNPASGEVIFS